MKIHTPYRGWINQPSMRQPWHRWHGVNVIALDEGNGSTTVYFLDGETTSMPVSTACVSEGWRHRGGADGL